jgi:8-oxo-dGTP pyrophosphatase MutT (NUDIX family)
LSEKSTKIHIKIAAMKKVVNYIPYKKTNGAVEVFVQRRSEDAPVRPNLLGLFGGGVKEGETDFVALHREVWDELAHIPVNPKFLGNYTDEVATNKNVYIEEVDTSFEKQICIGEGQYGQFMSRMQVEHDSDIAPSERQILCDLIKKVSR